MSGLLVQGELSPTLINRWNAERRFGRLFLQTNMLVLVHDVVLTGGVSVGHLRVQIAIWDGLIRELMHYLRGELAKMAESLPNLPAGSAAA
jgi:hypothetical protein